MQQLRSNLRLVERSVPAERGRVAQAKEAEEDVRRQEILGGASRFLRLLPASLFSRHHALDPLFPADRPRSAGRRRRHLPHSPEPRRDDPAGRRRHLLATPLGWRRTGRPSRSCARRSTAPAASRSSCRSSSRAELWEESGRWQRYGKEQILFHLKDRKDGGVLPRAHSRGGRHRRWCARA